MTKKQIRCKSCGGEMAADAKVCPNCGAKNKKPFYKKWWFWVIIAVIGIGALGSAGGSDTAEPSRPAASQQTAAAPEKTDMPVESKPETEPEPEPEPEPVSYAPYNVTELFDALDGNALKAERTYQDQYVELYGYLDNIDSDGQYISIGAGEENWDYMFQTIQCYITNDAQIDQILDMNTGDPITVRGKITDIGEILGYVLDIDSIN